MQGKIRSFAFCVLVYNHEKFIIEHLESIKFLIENYGEGINFHIIINDDCSRDKTLKLIDLWLTKNCELFVDVVKIYNDINVGTCSSLKNILVHLKADSCKITAGDDVYSFENMFKSASDYGWNDILSGAHLSLVDGELKKNSFDLFNVVSSDVIYKDGPLITRFKELNVTNAPNLIYKKKCLENKKIVEFFAKHDVVEDWPLQIAIAESDNDSKYYLLNTVFVYYRRTSGSAFIVASDRFMKDKISIFEYLIRNETSFFKRVVLKNRLLCFISDSKIVKRLLNFAVWIYAIKIIANAPSILHRYKQLSQQIDVAKHKAHCQEIQVRSRRFCMDLKMTDFNS